MLNVKLNYNNVLINVEQIQVNFNLFKFENAGLIAQALQQMLTLKI
jgi:hypothetical protein